MNHPLAARHVARAIAATAAAAFLAGCATAGGPDPYEAMNRKTFQFNEKVDGAVLKPVATAYRDHVPKAAQTGIGNFFSNLADPWSGLNLMLQGRFSDGFSDFGRFATNTTAGGLGLFDVATGWGMPKHGKSLGSTMQAWGVAPGPYLVMPLLGPSTLADAGGMPIDMFATGPGLVSSGAATVVLGGTKGVDRRADALPVTDRIDAMSLDKYLFTRDDYLQNREQRNADAGR